MKKIYHLTTCDTNRKILGSIDTDGFEMINIKVNPIDAETLDWLKSKVGSYFQLFNTKAQLYKLVPIEKRPKRDIGYRKFILSDYTYLKRPVIIDQEELFIGSDKSVVQKLMEHIPKK